MAISLEKRVEKVGIQLAKHNISKVPPVRVGLALDISGSAQGLYTRGVMQETVNRLQAIALKFDDNGELDMWTFSSGSQAFDRLATATAADYDGYVKRQILENKSVYKWGGTEYAPVIEDMTNFWFPGTTSKPVAQPKTSMFGGLFGKKAAPAPVATGGGGTGAVLPAMGLIVTDGQNSDRLEAAKILKASTNTNVYWQMIGVGDASLFRFIEEQADLLPNVGFVNLSSLEMTDEELYGALIADEFAGWIKQISK